MPQVNLLVEFCATEYLVAETLVIPELCLAEFDVDPRRVGDKKLVEFDAVTVGYDRKLVEFNTFLCQVYPVAFDVVTSYPVSFNVVSQSDKVLKTVDFNVLNNPYRVFVTFTAGGPVVSRLSVVFYVNTQFFSTGVPMTVRAVTGGTLTVGNKIVTVKIYQSSVLVCTSDAFINITSANSGIWADITGIPQIYGSTMVVKGYVKNTLTYNQTLPYSQSLGVLVA